LSTKKCKILDEIICAIDCIDLLNTYETEYKYKFYLYIIYVIIFKY